MIREVIRPQFNNFTINIPNSYIDREVEFIMFPLDEQDKVQEVKKEDISTFGGSLNKYSDLSKINLEDNAWELHVMDKYK
ncbi:MAG: hypothetical protein KAJ49_01620 [Arcobacteraceae bacterium]|nr:hypothetical protein [Arcobacteraceae bacterium]